MVLTPWRLALLTFAALALAAPSAAEAAVADRYVPFFDAADGVTTGRDSHGGTFMRFGPKVYRRIGGKPAEVACGSIIARPNGATPVSGGYTSSVFKLPRKRSRVYVVDGGSTRPMDVCTIATKRIRPEYPCLPNAAGESARCVRVIVALTDFGRAYLDARSRAIELFLIKSELRFVLDQTDKTPVDRLRGRIGRDIVTLPEPDALPPAGQVGLWVDGENYSLTALLQDGRPLFARFRDGVYSTNVHEFIRDEDPDHTTFSVFL
jgi:hypothetical protein